MPTYSQIVPDWDWIEAENETEDALMNVDLVIDELDVLEEEGY